MQPTAQSQQKKQKAAAINTAPTHKAIIYAASAFGFFICIANTTAFFFFLFSFGNITQKNYYNEKCK